jgi:hypothetical protein
VRQGYKAGAPGLFRYPLLLMFLYSSFALRAQTTTIPQGAPVGAPIGEASAQVLVFQIRSAFALTLSMVRSLQSKSGEGGQGQNGSLPQKPSSSSPEGAKDIAWGETLVRNVPFAVPLDVRLVGQNVVALIQIVPIEAGDANVNLFVQGQVWVKMPDNSLSFKTSIQTLSLPLGSRFYFYPLGVDSKTGAPIAVEIKVDGQKKQ